jgi:hypothetical protein
MRPQRVSTAGQKRGIFGRVRAKAGQAQCAGDISQAFVREIISESTRPVPAGSIDVMSHADTESAGAMAGSGGARSEGLDHDFVIETF